MTNRYDRDPDEYGRRESSRDEDPRRQGRQEAQGRYGDERYGRQNPWRGGQHERESESDWRAQNNRGEGHRDERWRDAGNSSESGYYAGRENPSLGRGYYSSGRDYDRHQDRQQSSGDRSRGDWGRHEERPSYRGYYQEQGWARDPGSGNVYGYEYSTRVDPRRFNAGDETNDRWRSDVNDQNRRFDIDRGWRGSGSSSSGGYGSTGSYGQSGGYGGQSGGYGTSSGGYGTSGSYGTSGYGSTTRGQSHFGKGPKGYVRSDDRIREDVCDRLSDDDEVDASDITVTVKNAEVILEGTVPDRHSKHRAEDIAESISGVKEVTNHLRARKGILQEIGDKLAGNDDAEHHGHAGSGTRNATGGTAPRTAH